MRALLSGWCPFKKHTEHAVFAKQARNERPSDRAFLPKRHYNSFFPSQLTKIVGDNGKVGLVSSILQCGKH